MITGAQSRAARKLLGWSYATLAKRAKYRFKTVARVEEHEGELPADLLSAACAMRSAFEAAGVEFLDEAPAVMLRKTP